MRVLDLMVSGGVGGIESLIREHALYTCHEHIYLFVWEGGVNADAIKSQGGKIVIFRGKEDNFFVILRKIIKLCRQENIEVIVSHHAAPLFKVVLIYAKWVIPGIKTIAYAHSNALDICKQKDGSFFSIRKWIHQVGFQHADVVIAISRSVKESLVKIFHIDDHKIKVIYNGIELDKFFPDTNCGGEDTGDIVKMIFVGRLIYEKGIQVTLRALSELHISRPYHFNIVGDGPCRNHLERLVEELGLSKQVTFLGNRNDVPDLLREADIFIHMPIWEEGFGISVIEAMAVGNICICANVGAMPEIISDKINGYLVDREDYKTLSEVLENICATNLKKDVTLHRIRSNAVKRAYAFSIEKFSWQFDEIIESIGRL